MTDRDNAEQVCDSGKDDIIIDREKECTKKRTKEIVLSTITIFYLFLSGFWLLPDSDMRKRVLEPFSGFVLFFGLEQNWKLFSPAIRNINYNTVGIITFENGLKEIWEPPRMERLDLASKFLKEKYRKWSVDALPWPSHKQFWPYIARYIGKQAYEKNGIKPVEFTLLLQWTEIPSPDNDKLNPRAAFPVHDKNNHIFTYRYKDEDLK